MAQHYARENEAVKRLLLEMIKKHSDSNEVISADHSTLLHAVARRGDTEFLRQLCQSGGLDLNRQDDQGKTALHLAFEFKKIEVAKVLLEVGADATRQDTMIPDRPRTAWQIAFHNCRELLNPLKNFMPDNLRRYLLVNENNFFNKIAAEAETRNKRYKTDSDQYDFAKSP